MDCPLQKGLHQNAANRKKQLRFTAIPLGVIRRRELSLEGKTMTVHNPNFASLLDEVTTDEAKCIDMAIKPLLGEIQTLARKDDIDTDEKVELYGLATSVLKNGRKALQQQQQLSPAALLGTSSNNGHAALPAGSNAAGNDDVVLSGDDAIKYRTLLQMFGGANDRLLDNVVNVFGPLNRTSGDELTKILNVIVKVANKTFKVMPDGKLELENILSTTQRELSDTQEAMQRNAGHPQRASQAPAATRPNAGEAALKELLERGRYTGPSRFRGFSAKLGDLSQATLDAMSSIKPQ
jgi:hypothetical protein